MPIRNQQGTNGSAFADVLAKAQGQPSPLRFSAHAESRLLERGLNLSKADLTRIQSAVDKAGSKGAKDAYVVYGDTGFVVNVPNRTVITAMANHDDPVVTNIDSVVVVSRPDH
ncbi:MAG: hypothetical protein A2201_04400 [Alicyclobacillus sp. RIFOXYA1_FULL_53_8]|nr:MAG: hypothetical protein A2201_04400 [Alicyclobacillus sp. RIFOXYA1_FULL_53_8]